jgi:hypothetical protein
MNSEQSDNLRQQFPKKSLDSRETGEEKGTRAIAREWQLSATDRGLIVTKANSARQGSPDRDGLGQISIHQEQSAALRSGR